MRYGIYQPLVDSLDKDLNRFRFNLLNIGINMKVAMKQIGIPVIKYYEAQLKAIKK